MRFSCPSADFKAAVTFAHSATAKSAKIPVLMGVKAEVSQSGLTLRACNLSVWASAEITCEAEGEDLIMPALDLLALSRRLPSDKVVAELADNAMQITCGRLGAKIPVGDPQGFPAPRPEIEMKAVDESFTQALRAASHAMAVNDARDYLCGVYMDHDRMVATNTQVMTEAHSPCPSGLIPNTAVPLIISLLGDGGRFGCDGKLWAAERDGKTLSGACIATEYPAYRSVTEADDIRGASQVAILDRDDLSKVMDQATLGDHRAVRISGHDGTLTISTVGGMREKDLSGRVTASSEASAPAEILADFSANVATKHVASALAAMPETVAVYRSDRGLGQLIFRPLDRSAFLDRQSIVSEFRSNNG